MTNIVISLKREENYFWIFNKMRRRCKTFHLFTLDSFLNGVCACVLSHFSHICLCNSTDCSPPSSSVNEIIQARMLEWIAMPSSRQSSWRRDRTQISPIAGIFLTCWVMWEAHFEWFKMLKVKTYWRVKITALHNCKSSLYWKGFFFFFFFFFFYF